MKKVLIVDDSIFVRILLKSILSQNGYMVIAEASDGKEAVEKYKQYNPDIVTMDITMPKKNGVTALKEIFKYDKYAKIIMISALTQKKYILESLKLGAKDFLFKPLNSEVILSTINSIN